jgi:hypothetical protein
MSPTRDPGFHLSERHCVTIAEKDIVTPTILAGIWTIDVDDRIKQRHCFGQHRRNILTALGRHLLEPLISIRVDLKGSAD